VAASTCVSAAPPVASRRLGGQLDRDRHYAVTPTAAWNASMVGSISAASTCPRTTSSVFQPSPVITRNDPLVVADVAALGELGQDRRGDAAGRLV